MLMPIPPAARLEALHSFDSDADALAWLWLDTQADHSTVQRQAQQRVSLAQARGERRTAAFSTACEALRLALLAALEPGTRARVDQLLLALPEEGCPRALLLGQAAWVQAHWGGLPWAEMQPGGATPALLAVGQPSQLPKPPQLVHALRLLTLHGSAADDPRPPAERFWTDAGLCLLHTAAGHHHEARACGLRAQVLAHDMGHDLLQALAALRLASASSDSAWAGAESRHPAQPAEGTPADALLQEAAAAASRCGRPPVSLCHALLQALLWAGKPARAGAWLDTQTWLLNPALLQRTPALCLAAAWARAEEGRLGEAQALLGLAPGAAQQPLPALQLCARARTLLLLGQAAQARALLEAGLARLLTPGLQVPAAQVMRLQGLLSQACAVAADAGRVAVGTHERAAAAPVAPPDAGAPHARSRFLAHLAHELRNPLFGVQGAIELLQMSQLSAEQRRVLELAQRSSQMMLELCNDVLDLARMDQHRFVLRPHAVCVAELLDHATQSLLPRAQARGLGLRWVSDGRLPPWLLCDGLRLQQVLHNLLHNAIKFTHQGGVTMHTTWQPRAAAGPGNNADNNADNSSSNTVSHSADTGPPTGPSGLLTVVVHDTGPGLTEQAQRQLFTEFSQLTEPGAAGAGLGLAISHGLVQQMGGRMGVHSQPGQGSRFWFSLPLQAVAAPG